MDTKDKGAQLSKKIRDLEQRFKKSGSTPTTPRSERKNSTSNSISTPPSGDTVLASLPQSSSSPSLRGGRPGGNPNRPVLSGIKTSRAKMNLSTDSRRRMTPDTNPRVTNLRVPDSSEIEAKYQEIMKLTGVLDLGEKGKVQCEQTDLEDLGELGKGTCGQVFTMKHKPSGQIMAVKQMRRSGNREENKRIIMDLETVLKSHSCPFIVHCYGIFITESDVWICMELMATCLDKLLKRTSTPIPEEIIRNITVAVLKALNYLKEAHGVIHRDIKPSNILLDGDGSVKLCDFGISGRLVDSKAITRTGTACAGYMAPERIQPPDPFKPDYDIRADVWSLGVTLVELATGEFPYKSCKTDFEVLSSILESPPPSLPDNKEFSEDFKDFIRLCVTKNYKDRPKYKRLLEHPFIKNCQTTEIEMASWYKQTQGTG